MYQLVTFRFLSRSPSCFYFLHSSVVHVHVAGILLISRPFAVHLYLRVHWHLRIQKKNTSVFNSIDHGSDSAHHVSCIVLSPVHTCTCTCTYSLYKQKSHDVGMGVSTQALFSPPPPPLLGECIFGCFGI